MALRAVRWAIWVMSGAMVVGLRYQIVSAATRDSTDSASIQLKASHANEQYRQSRYDEAILTDQAILASGVENLIYGRRNVQRGLDSMSGNHRGIAYALARHELNPCHGHTGD